MTTTPTPFKLRESHFGLDAGILLYAESTKPVPLQYDHLSVRLKGDHTGPVFLMPASYLEPVTDMIPTLINVEPTAIEKSGRRVTELAALLAEAVEVIRGGTALHGDDGDLIDRIDDALGTATPECGVMASRCQMVTNVAGGFDHCVTCGGFFQH